MDITLFSLKNVSFKDIIHYPALEITENRATFICGESGCGKSTLLKLLNGIISADSGEILYCNKPLDEYDPVSLRREVLLCGQAAFLFDGSIKQNFAQYCKYRDLPSPVPQEMQQYLKICAAEFPLDADCLTMSGGERQRIFTAVCLSLRPKVLLLDEPTAALDDLTANTVIANIKAFCRQSGITLIIVSHNKALAEMYADCTIILEANHE
jgi:putative ABC transport system ATP-binding protein